MKSYREIISITVWAEDKKLEDIIKLNPTKSLKKKIGKPLNEEEYNNFVNELEDYKKELEKRFNPEQYYIHTFYLHHLRSTKKKGFLERLLRN